jgi:hypothetical protein
MGGCGRQAEEIPGGRADLQRQGQVHGVLIGSSAVAWRTGTQKGAQRKPDVDSESRRAHAANVAAVLGIDFNKCLEL